MNETNYGLDAFKDAIFSGVSFMKTYHPDTYLWTLHITKLQGPRWRVQDLRDMFLIFFDSPNPPLTYHTAYQTGALNSWTGWVARETYALKAKPAPGSHSLTKEVIERIQVGPVEAGALIRVKGFRGDFHLVRLDFWPTAPPGKKEWGLSYSVWVDGTPGLVRVDALDGRVWMESSPFEKNDQASWLRAQTERGQEKVPGVPVD